MSALLRRVGKYASSNHHLKTAGGRHFSKFHEATIPSSSSDIRVVDWNSQIADDETGMVRRVPLESFAELYDEYKDEQKGMIRTKYDGFIQFLNPEPFKDLRMEEIKGKVTTYWPDTTRELLGKGSFGVLYGPKHVQIRKILNPFFHDDVLRERFDMVCDQTDRLLNSLVDDTVTAMNSEGDKYLDVFYYGRTWSWNITFNFTFGSNWKNILNLEKNGIDEQQLFLDFIDYTKGLVDLNMDNLHNKDTPLGYGMHKREFVMRDIAKLIRLCQENIDKIDEKCMMYRLLQAQTDIDIDNLAEQLLLLIWAGHETTAFSMANLLYCIDQFPQDNCVMFQQFCDEVTQHRRDTNNEMDYDFIMQQQYLDYFVKEVMRYVPGVPYVPKIFTEDVEINGCPFSKGDMYCMNAATSRNKTIFKDENNLYKDLSEFDPLRWQTPPEKYSWLPFGFGSKMCLGWRLALIELKLMTIFCVKNLDFKLDKTRSLTKADSGFNYYEVYAQFFRKKQQ